MRHGGGAGFGAGTGSGCTGTADGGAAVLAIELICAAILVSMVLSWAASCWEIPSSFLLASSNLTPEVAEFLSLWRRRRDSNLRSPLKMVRRFESTPVDLLWLHLSAKRPTYFARGIDVSNPAPSANESVSAGSRGRCRPKSRLWRRSGPATGREKVRPDASGPVFPDGH